jgi:hypothetical protein
MSSSVLTTDKKNEILEKMKGLPCGVYKLDPKDEVTQEAFKYIIREGQDNDNGFELSFNTLMNKIQKRLWNL